MHLKPFPPWPSPRSCCMPAALLADTPASTQWVVTSAKVSGGGNDYVTSLRIVNPNAFAVEVDMYFLPQTPLDASNNALGDNSGAPKVVVTVPANSTLALDDVLASKFGDRGRRRHQVESFAATGGLNPDPAGVWVLSQTLVVNARNQAGTPGTNGFAIPSQNQDQVVALGETAYVPYISGSRRASPSGYRTNLFLLSTNATGTTDVTVTLRKGDGTSLGSKNLTLGKLSQTQINNIASFFGYVPSRERHEPDRSRDGDERRTRRDRRLHHRQRDRVHQLRPAREAARGEQRRVRAHPGRLLRLLGARGDLRRARSTTSARGS